MTLVSALRYSALGACLTAVISIAANPPLPPPGSDIPTHTFRRWLSAVDEAGVDWHGGTYLNALVLQNSPYLRQHAGNPVNWEPWSEESLARASSQNKPIFLSIGYSACHWCHVMNRESFSDPDIARLINESFVAIKVDREVNPEIDQHFSRILSMVKGSAGWPLTAVLDSEGRPVFIDAYLTRQALVNTLSRIADLAVKRPAYLSQSARMLASATAASPATGYSGSEPVTESELGQVAVSLLDKMDDEYGGMEGSQKFPAESALLFLTDMVGRRIKEGVYEALALQLEQMAVRGMYDHVNGGFFRYSTDRHWTVPHYEKMLYNQAMLLQAYGGALKRLRRPLYRWLLSDLVDFLADWMEADSAGFFSAVSAESSDVEGLYYFWSREALDALPAGEKGEAGFASYPAPRQDSLRGIYMLRPGGAVAADLRRRLQLERRAVKKPDVDRKIITAWNAALLSGLVVTAMATHDESRQSIGRIERLADFLWANLYVEDQAVLHRFVYEDQRGTVGTLEDYAFLAKAFIDVYDLTLDHKWLNRARQLGDALIDNFSEEGRFVFTDSRRADAFRFNTGSMADGELPSAQAIAVQALWRLALRSGDQRLRYELGPFVNRLRAAFRAGPLGNLYAAVVLAEIDLGSVEREQYFAGGNGRIKVRFPVDIDADPCKVAEINVNLGPGWHVNSNGPFQDYLKPTRVRAVAPQHGEHFRVSYPEPAIESLSSDKGPLSLYDGEFTLGVLAGEAGNCKYGQSALDLVVELQACTDRLCMPMESLRIALP